MRFFVVGVGVHSVTGREHLTQKPLPPNLRPLPRSRPLLRLLLPPLFERSQPLGAGLFFPLSEGVSI